VPLYEYRCTKCGHLFEKIQSFTAEDVKDCPLCGSPVERLISAPAVHFSGSGFYKTDYNKSRNAPPATSSATPSAGSGDSNSSSASDKGDSAKSAPAPAPSAPTSTSSSSSESKS
jgi:putative FmdB family regulatory protein